MSLALKKRLAQERAQQINLHRTGAAGSAPQPRTNSNHTTDLDHDAPQAEHSFADNTRPPVQLDQSAPPAVKPPLPKGSAPLNQPKTTQAPAPPLSTKPSMSSIAASAKDNNTKPAKQTTTDKKTASAAAPVRSLVAESPRKTEKPSARDKSNIKSEGGGAKRAKIDNNNNTATTVREGKATSKPQVPLAAKPHAAAADKKPVDTANKKAAEATTKGPSPPKVPVLAFELGQQEATKKLGNIALGSVSSYSDFKTVVSKQFADAFSESGGKRSVVFKDEEGDWIFMNGAIPWSVVQAAAKQVMIVPKNLTKKK